MRNLKKIYNNSQIDEKFIIHYKEKQIYNYF